MKNKDTPDNTLAIEDKPKKLTSNQKSAIRRKEEEEQYKQMEKSHGGRPLKFETEQELADKIEEYKQYIADKNKPPTIAGLAYFLDIDRGTLYNYGRKEKYFNTIKRAVDWIMLEMEEMVLTSTTPAGKIFLMKNYGYSDKQDTSVTVNVSLETQLKDMQGDEF